MRRRTSILCIVIVAPLVAGCGIFESDEWAERRRALERSRDRWTDELVHTYRYTLTMGCFCPAAAAGAVVIEVTDGQITSLVPVRPDVVVPEEEWFVFATVQSLFALIEAAVDQRADRFEVYYDARLGYPRSIVLDFERQSADDEVWIQAADLEIVARFGTWE